jgi:hypothetical protein
VQGVRVKASIRSFRGTRRRRISVCRQPCHSPGQEEISRALTVACGVDELQGGCLFHC